MKTVPFPRLFPGILSITLAAALLASCSHKPQPLPPAELLELPESFTLYDTQAPSPDRWWEGFASSELDRLVQEALSENLTLGQAFARLEQSRASAVKAGEDLLPDLRLTAGATEGWREDGGGTDRTRTRSLTLASAWELDFWGRIREGRRAALLDLEASRENLYNTALTIASEVTGKWLEVISVRRQIALQEEQLKTNRTILELVEQRYLKGLATALDIYQQRQAVAESEASMPILKARLQTASGELAVLLGHPPGTDLGLMEDAFPEPGPLPETGVPSGLLSRRPDIRAAGLMLRASEAQAAAARAGRLPAVTLSASAGYSSETLGDLLDHWLANLAANLTWSLFDSGSKRAEVTRQEALAKERLASYRQTVLEAILEVEDAMRGEVSQTEYIRALKVQLGIARDGYREALSRYRKGISDYLPTLTALLGTQRLERSLLLAEQERLNQRIRLHRSLGGNWMEGMAR